MFKLFKRSRMNILDKLEVHWSFNEKADEDDKYQ